jgi:hypothetical protein
METTFKLGRKYKLIGIPLLLAATFAGCGHGDGWQPRWETIADKGKTAKLQLAPTIAFDDEELGFIPMLGSDEEKKRHQREKDTFARAFQNEPACKDLILLRTNPKSADFAFQIFNGIDGRVGKWQWVLYRTDTVERLDYGEATNITSAVQSICSAVQANVKHAGGKVE